MDAVKAFLRHPSGMAGLVLLTIVLIPVSVLLVVFAMRGFAQKWNVEVEKHSDDYRDHDDYRDRGPAPAGA